MSKFENLTKDQLIEMLVIKENQIEVLKTENIILRHSTIMATDTRDEFFSLKQIIALMPGTVFWKNKEGIYLGCNNNMAQFLGLDSPNDIVGKCNRDLMSIDLADPLDKTDKNIIDSGEGKYTEEVANIQSEEAIFYTQKIPLTNRIGKIIGLLGISIDITKRKRMEEKLQIAKEKAEASDKAKSEFLAIINHELRTPLTGILGLIDILKDDNLCLVETKKITADLENCAQYLLSLVNNVLDFSQLEAEKKNIHLSPVNLSEVITEVASIVTVLAESKKLNLETFIDENIPYFVMTDGLALHQILINITNNAIKFTDQGQITIKLKRLAINATHVQIEISIHDTGKGIPTNQLDSIFNPFHQLDNTYIRSSSRNGTGLGLAIVKKLAQLLNIEVRVESKVGKGSSFYLTSNFKIHEISSATRPNFYLHSEAHLVNEDKKIRILLVEDDKIVQHVHTKILAECGYEVTVASSGQKALQLFNGHDMIFVDIGLPDIDGFELIGALRNHAEVRKNLPIIALTGYTGEKEKSACLSAGANEVIIKPIPATKLRNIVKQYLPGTILPL